MGIQTEYNPDLALRSYEYIEQEGRAKDECLPQQIKVGMEYSFLKKGQRNFYLLGEIPLLTTQGNSKLSMPIASIQIIQATHFIFQNQIWTKGTYKVTELILKDQIRYNGFAKLN